ncbi:hypothetical protein DSO57_1029940 [Entomophthora muscae]|uniref:Uncharacterized protein n=1 Tax=Entomophthora muscae TaxID=34485 RepID=A0ACC2T132_9FUNG|nr:hypothetical protein DSO57_1029940 [Entomophthora muscae]
MAHSEEGNNLDLTGLEIEERRDTLPDDFAPPLPPRTSQNTTPKISATSLTANSGILDLGSSTSLSYLSSISNEKGYSSYTTAGSMNLVELVNKLLRPTETCHICSEVRYTRSTGYTEERLLAVVSSSEGESEESCVFLLKRNGPRSITIRLTLPIFSDFRISLTQSKPVTLDEMNFATRQSNSTLQPDHVLKLSSGGRELHLELQTLNSLQALVVEIKRLSAIAVRENHRLEGNTHRWVKFYAVSDRSSSPEHGSQADNVNGLASILSPASPFYRPLESQGSSAEIVNPLVIASPGLVDESLSLEEENARRLKAIKEEWVQKEMQAREDQFTTYDQMRLFVGTWNVNGKYATQSLSPWLLDGNEEEPDIYVLGFQELDLSAEAFLINDSLREEEWCAAVVQGLGDKADQYTKLISKQLVGMFLVIFIKTCHSEDVSEMATDSAGVGIMGMMGNKGAVAIRMRLRDSYFCFVNSHLAADTGQVERRNQDFQDICRRIGFPMMTPNNRPSQLKSPMFKTNAMSLPRNPRLLTIFDADHLFWLGDLNYRISLPVKQVIDKVKEGNLEHLLRFDQLKLQQLSGKAFSEFTEGPITFTPTYKYDIGTDNFDSSEKKRTPSWCDRILWRSLGPIEQTSYTSHMSLISSDHKPVSGRFTARVKTILDSRYSEVYSAMIRELDKFENQSMPDAAISASQLNFGTVQYLQSKELSISIENTGQVYLQFQFIPKMDEDSICKPWLWVNPPNGMIMPGERLRVTFIMLVDRRSAPQLNLGLDRLDDILILHLTNGKDYFISVSGAYQPTSLAVGLDHLTRLPKPIRLMEPQDALLPLENQLSVPFVLWRIVDFIHQYGMEVEHLFLTPGDQHTMLYIRECLDTGDDFDLDRLLIDPTHAPPPLEEGVTSYDPPPIDSVSPAHLDGIHSMAEMLIRFLEALPIPVIPFSLYDLCLEASVIGKDAAVQALETLPRIHLNTFLYITSMLKEVIANQQTRQDFLVAERLGKAPLIPELTL